MHQKHPPAKIAVLVVADGSAASLGFAPESVAITAIDANKNLLIGATSPDLFN